MDRVSFFSPFKPLYILDVTLGRALVDAPLSFQSFLTFPPSVPFNELDVPE